MQQLIPEKISPNAESLEQINQQIAQNFHHRSVRDLAWALLSPTFFVALPDINQEWLSPIWRDNKRQEDELITWLYQLDAQIEPLIAHLKDQRATRLGIYFEQLLSFYFSHYPRFTLLAKNLQANSEKRTIGEYDFIVWDKQDQQHFHVEVAIKFYIGAISDMSPIALNIPKNTPKYNWHLWIGPNKKDSLAIKLNHLLQHQLCLSQTDAGKAALETIGLTAAQLKPKLLLTGRLYLPHPLVENNQETTVSLPEHGQYQPPFTQHWYDKKTLNTLLKDPSNTNEFTKGKDDKNNDISYVVLPRQLWMSVLTEADITNNNEMQMLSKEELLLLLENSLNEELPLHIAQLIHISPQQDLSTISPPSSPTIIERQRFFIL
jgi:hypothetical protein